MTDRAGRGDEMVPNHPVDPGWPILRPTDVPGPATWHAVRASLSSRGARSWYLGAGISLIWLISPGQGILQVAATPLSATIGIAVLVLYGAAFLLSGPLQWPLPAWGRIIVFAALLGISLLLTPWLGWQIAGVWTYVGVAWGMAAMPWRVTWPGILALSAVAVAFEFIAHGGYTDNVLWVPAIVLSVSLMMSAFAHTQATTARLRMTQRHVEALAAERERGRVARDLHDILGHSLTVIAAKSELGERLVDLDPERAKAEMADVAGLARGALADVRATVAGFRGVSVGGELAAVRVALDAADIALDAPVSADAVHPEHRELAGWVLREGVTNVIRHAQATRCRVRLGSASIAIDDDGVGPAPAAGGSGLTGLRERVDAAGGTLSIGRSDLGGFRLEVRL
ncbi:MAG TPA: sensor histidine kinase [Microbacterium sp.]|uniref:sensor histidine kinase n=1 Tax=Microbacterium sp. TaxID=51671 RepID=UPI002B46AA87|nr:sensor histidine kinase [Microbacterium sp.]HKT55331.1 sensor histidine kinase [Microbacterium sp.]